MSNGVGLVQAVLESVGRSPISSDFRVRLQPCAIVSTVVFGIPFARFPTVKHISHT